MYVRIPTHTVENTVDRTIAKKVISDLKNNLDIDNRAFIALSNIFEQNTFKSGINVSLDKNIVDNPIADMIEAKIETRKVNNMTTIKPYNEAKTIFKNKHMKISTEYINYEMVISIIYKTKSKVKAKKLEDQIRNHYKTNGTGFNHIVDYYYVIPNVLSEIMLDVHETGLLKDPNKTTFVDFIKSGNIYNLITARSDINGSQGILGLAVTADTKLHGLFESDISNTVSDHDRDKGEWSIVMDYKLNYMSPVSFIVDFEMVVNNNLIPMKYLVAKTKNPEAKRVKDELYTEGYSIIQNKYDYVAIPPQDNHTPFIPNRNHMTPIMSVLVVLENENTMDVFNLNQLKYYKLEDNVIEYITKNRLEVTRATPTWYHSIFILDLYKDNKLQPRETISLTEDLTVRFNELPDITGTYRVVLSLMTNKKYLTPEALKNASMFSDTIDTIITKTGNDFRLADSNLPKELRGMLQGNARTVQISTVNTFLKKTNR